MENCLPTEYSGYASAAAATVAAAAAPVVLKHHAVLDTGDRVEDVASTHLGALV